MKRAVLVALLTVSAALAAIKTYEVVPCSNYVARVPGDEQHGVTQYFRNTVDSLMVAGSWLLVEGRVGDVAACAAGMRA